MSRQLLDREPASVGKLFVYADIAPDRWNEKVEYKDTKALSLIWIPTGKDAEELFFSHLEPEFFFHLALDCFIWVFAPIADTAGKIPVTFLGGNGAASKEHEAPSHYDSGGCRSGVFVYFEFASDALVVPS